MIGRRSKVSIIVPVYNVEKYLSSCLLSCINQTLYDIEIVCVNDGSTDNSLKILRQFAAVDHRIVIVDKPNGGLSSARNAGIKHATGEYIMFLDSDDFLSYTACERVWKETNEGPADIVIFGTAIFPDKPKAGPWYYNVLNIWTHRYDSFTPKVLFREPGAKPFVWRQAFKRSLFDEAHLLFDENVRYGEDVVFQMEAFPHAKSFAFISDQLYHYRWHREGSLMSSYRTDQDERIRQHIALVDTIAAYWQKQGWLETYNKDFCAWILEFLMVDVYNRNTKYPDEHIASVSKLINKYGLEMDLSKTAAQNCSAYFS